MVRLSLPASRSRIHFVRFLQSVDVPKPGAFDGPGQDALAFEQKLGGKFAVDLVLRNSDLERNRVQSIERRFVVGIPNGRLAIGVQP